jgi:hypothetical protein
MRRLQEKLNINGDDSFSARRINTDLTPRQDLTPETCRTGGGVIACVLRETLQRET